MGIILMRVFFNLWSCVAFVFILNSVSHALFGAGTVRGKIKNIIMGIWFPLIWPISVWSPEGRKVLFGKFHEL